MDGWDGWGSPIGEIAETADIGGSVLDIDAFAYRTGRVSHDEDVRQQIAAVLAAEDPYADTGVWPLSRKRGRPREVSKM